MAMEAAAQVALAKEQAYDKFEIRDVVVTHPVVIPEEDLELTITLRPHQEGSLVASETWSEFKICSWSPSQGWKEHCKGLIALESKEENGVTSAKQIQDSNDRLQSVISAISQDATNPVVSSAMYDALSVLGVAYGPTFQGIQDCQAGPGSAAGHIKVTDAANEMPNKHLASPLIHPSFLESLIEMYWPILASRSTTLDTVYLPSSVRRISVSRDVVSLAGAAGATFPAYCKGDFPFAHPKPTKVSMFAVAETSSQLLIEIDDLLVSPILEHESQADANHHREICYKIDWEPILAPLHLEESTVKGVQEAPDEAKYPETDVVIVHEDSEQQKELAQSIATVLEATTGKRPVLGNLAGTDVAGKVCIFLSELEKPLLPSLTEEEFGNLQKALTTVEGILWVVRGAYEQSENPDANMIMGLSRTIRSETLLRFATLDLDSRSRLSEENTRKAILEVFKAAFGSKSSASSELEFMERAGSFFTPRIINDAEMNEFVHRQTKDGVLEPTPFDETRRLKMTIETTGALDTIHFVDDTDKNLAVADDQIDIRVKAIGLNHRDVAAAHGKLATADFGVEVSGIVTAIGNDVTNFQVGDHVAAMTTGAFATSARAEASNAFKIPSDMSFENAATVPLAYVTAYYSLVELGRLEAGETILIHAAAGGVGQAAVALAQMIGAKVFATVGSAEKKQFLMSEYGLPEDQIFYSRDSSFGPRVRQACNDKGVDLVLNCLSGETVRESWQCLGKFGKFIEIGGGDSRNTSLEMSNLNSNASFLSVDIFGIASDRPKVLKRLLAEVAQLLGDGRIRPISPVTTFSIADTDAAFKTLQGGKSHGKIVVVPGAGDLVEAPARKLSNLLRPDASYVLIGGTGGLGRSMARWMLGQGAKHIVLVSRSGSATGKVQELIEDAQKVDAEIVVRSCNVADRGEVDNLIKSGLEGMPPVRGVVHGAMVLHDVLFEKMSYNEYVTVVESKVKGAWNFHNALINEPLDFFVAISSVAGAVGNRGQAAYAAANCFLNAFVQYRLALGLPAASVDPTAISDSGYLAEDAEAAAEVARNLGSDTCCEAEVLALLGAAIDGKLASACGSHTIMGCRMTPSMQPFWTPDAKFKHLREAMEAQAAAEASSMGTAAISYNAALKAAKSPEEAQEVVCKGLVYKIAVVLMMEEEELDITRSLTHYPLDSLVAIEIRNFITREFEANLQVLELLSSGSIQTLAKAVCAKSKLVSS